MDRRKQQLRKDMKARRAVMSAQAVQLASEAIRDRLLAMQQVSDAVSVFAYVSANHEPDTHSLIHHLLALGKRVSVPRIDSNNEIQPHGITTLADLQPGGAEQFNLLVPAIDAPIESDPTITLVPGLAFTRTGQRLGMGGGYYDRFLVKHPDTVAVGLCYDWQIVDNLPTEPHDQRVDVLIAEAGVVSCG